MPLTRQNFREQIDSTIFKRGQRYFNSDAVQELEQLTDNQWSATVLGSQDYTVTITEEKDGTLMAMCDCPYDWGPTCKHIVAALLKLDETPIRPKTKKRKPRKTRADRVREAIAPLSHSDLVELLVEIAIDNGPVAQLLLSRYGAVENSKGEAARLAREAIQMGQHRGFIDYNASFQVSRGLQALLRRADTFLNKNQLNRALPIYQAVLEETATAIGHADDSSGSLGDCIEQALAGIGFVAQNATGKLQQSLFTYLLKGATHKRYQGWDWGWSQASIAANLVDSAKSRHQLDSTLQTLLDLNRRDYEWGNQHQQDTADAIRLSIIQRLDDEKTVLEFLEARQNSNRFFPSLVAFHVDRGSLQTARQLVEAQIRDSADSRRSNTDLHAMLLNIAQLEGRDAEVTNLLETLFTQTGRFEYYDRLKATQPPDWPQVVKRLAKNLTHTWSVGEIYVREAMWSHLLATVQGNPHQVRQYHQHLAKRFPAEVAAIYMQLAEATLKQKVNRKGYKEAISYLRKLGELGQGAQMHATVAHWRTTYNKRRALLDELNKAFGQN